MIEKVVKKFSRFEEAEKAEIEYWQNLPLKKKLEMMNAIQLMQLEFFYPGVTRIEKVIKKRKLGEEEELKEE